jgi:3-oxoacyl-[acyl-carrier-protein] synthase-3
MKYENVCIESFGFTLPEEIVTSDEIETRLTPLYERLKLPAGRLELMTGIAERRFWPRGTLPSEKSIESARRALAVAHWDPQRVGALIHGSVCRDHLEPATACRVHHALDLPPSCVIYDVSNACLGLMNGMLQAANMIELGQISSALVVGTEAGRNLVEATIESLNSNLSLTRNQIKLAVASLTIGSASCAILLTNRQSSQTDNRIRGAAVRAHTEFHRLCHSDKDDAIGDGMQPLMTTDSEALMREGVRTGQATFSDFLKECDLDVTEIDRAFCHQVGSAHRKLMLESLGLTPEIDYATLQWLGNTGSVALPITMACGLQHDFVNPGDRIGMLGIGSGINSVMIGVDWQKSLVASNNIPVSAAQHLAQQAYA